MNECGGSRSLEEGLKSKSIAICYDSSVVEVAYPSKVFRTIHEKKAYIRSSEWPLYLIGIVHSNQASI